MDIPVPMHRVDNDAFDRGTTEPFIVDRAIVEIHHPNIAGCYCVPAKTASWRMKSRNGDAGSVVTCHSQSQSRVSRVTRHDYYVLLLQDLLHAHYPEVETHYTFTVQQNYVFVTDLEFYFEIEN